MFNDLEVTSSITKSYGDSAVVFHVKPLAPQGKMEISRRYYWFHQGDIRSSMGNYSGKVLYGPLEKFDRKGNLLEKGMFVDGLKTGPWVSYYSNGNLKRSLVYDNGWIVGRFKEYYSNGVVAKDGRYVRNKLSGRVNIYDNAGNLIARDKFKDGNLVKEKEKKTKPADSVKRKIRLWKKTKKDSIQSNQVAAPSGNPPSPTPETVEQTQTTSPSVAPSNASKSSKRKKKADKSKAPVEPRQP